MFVHEHNNFSVYRNTGSNALIIINGKDMIIDIGKRANEFI